jgi:membrane-bound serine protease (ClpP class)
MRDRLRIGAALLLVAAATGGGAAAAPPEEPALKGPFHRLHVIDFEGEIEPVLAAYVKRSVEKAKKDAADCVILRIESPGGRVDSSEEIADYLLDLPAEIHTVAWVEDHAYSGAAMVSLSCREIVMGKQAHLGDSQPIMISPDEGFKPAGEKIESPLRAKFRAYAERNGYPTLLAEAMVSAHIEVLKVRDREGRTYYVGGEAFRDADPEAEIVPGVRRRDLAQVGSPVLREGELLTMTSVEARDLGFLKRRFLSGNFPSSEQELLTSLKAADGTVAFVEMSASERVSRWLLDFTGILGAVASIALLLLFFKGPSTFTLVGGACLLLILLIHATAGQVHALPLFVLAVGALLLAAEVFLIPGFGFAGVLGMVALGTGFLMLAVGASFESPRGVDWDAARSFGLQFVLTVALGLVTIFVLARAIPSVGPGRRMVLAPPSGPAVPVVPGPSAKPGERGVALSPLRPAGSAEVAGRVVDVVTEGEYADAGTPVVVVAVEGPRVVVRPARGSGTL